MKKAALAALAALALAAACSDQGAVGPSGPDYSAAPAAPTGFAVNGLSATCVELRWNDASDNETGFILQRATNDGFTEGLVETTLPAGTVRYRDYESIAPGTTRYYRVLASNEAGRSAPSAPATAVRPGATTPSTSRIADHTVVDLIRKGMVPIAAIEAAKSNLHIAYGHTSHGSQIASGMSGLVDFANAGRCDGTYDYSSEQGLFAWSQEDSGGTALHLHEGDGYDEDSPTTELRLDCGYDTWQPETVEFLGTPNADGRGSNHPDINVVMWSWCGQAAGYTEQGMIDSYLNLMSALEATYPGIAFVYMTCHLNGTGTEGNLHARNEQIRQFCRADPDRWLFDFADIETYDPDGVYYGEMLADDACGYDFNGNGSINRNDDGELINGDRNWGADWQSEHQAGVDWFDCGAAHSQSIVANMKAYAIWWLWCEIAESLAD